MSKNDNPSFLYSQASKLADSALRLAQRDNYPKSIENYNKSNRLLMKIVLSASNLNNSEDTKQKSTTVSNNILKKSYLLLGENFDALKKLYVLLDDKEKVFEYLNKSEKYLLNYLKLSKKPERYYSYLSNLFSSAVTFEKYKDLEQTYKYAEKYIKNFSEAIKEGANLNEVVVWEYQILLDLFTNLVKNNPSYMKRGLELFLSTLNDLVDYLDRETIEGILLFNVWLPFATQVGIEIAESYPEFILENRTLVLETLNYVKESFLNVVEQETGELKIILGVLSLFARYSDLFKDPEDIKTLYNIEEEMYYALTLYGEEGEIACAISNLIDVLEWNPNIANDFTLVKLYSSLFRLFCKSHKAAGADNLRAKLLSRLETVKTGDVKTSSFDISDQNIEDEYNLAKAEAYYSLSLVEGELGNREKAIEYIKESKKLIREVKNSNYAEETYPELSTSIDHHEKELISSQKDN